MLDLHRMSPRGPLVWLALLPVPAVVLAGQTRPDRTIGLPEAINRLTEEAEQAREQQRLPRARANFSAEVDLGVPLVVLGRKLTRPLHHQPFVDAYVRWQLTSFDPPLPSMDGRRLERFLSGLPPLLDNPRAEESLIASLNAAVGAGSLSERDQAAMGRRLDELAERASRVRRFNQPAMAFRKWIQRKLPETGVLPLEAGLERCRALVEAGWSVDRDKARLEAIFEASARDRSFTDQQRRQVAERAQQLAGRQRLYVASARLRNGALAVDYGNAAVYDFDVNRWLRLMENE